MTRTVSNITGATGASGQGQPSGNPEVPRWSPINKEGYPITDGHYFQTVFAYRRGSEIVRARVPSQASRASSWPEHIAERLKLLRMVQKKMEKCTPSELDRILDTIETDAGKIRHWENAVDYFKSAGVWLTDEEIAARQAEDRAKQEEIDAQVAARELASKKELAEKERARFPSDEEYEMYKKYMQESGGRW